MKTYEELTETEQGEARTVALPDLLTDLLEGVRFSDELNHDTLQASIDAACERANDKGTPWFASEYIMDARYDPGEGHIKEADGLWPVKEILEGMALCQAEDTLYSESTEHVVAGIVARKEG